MNVFILEIPYQHQGKEDMLFPVLLQHGKELLLVDCGYEDSLPALEKAIGLHGFSLAQLTGLVLTHHDIDHVGGASAIKERVPGISVYSSASEAACISGAKKSLRLQQAEDLDACLPDEWKPAARQFLETLRNVKPVPVDCILDGQTSWPLSGEVDVIPTPGHTPGHFSLYLKKQKTLLAADALVIEDGRLALANPQFAMDLPAAVASVNKLRQLAVDKLVCYHGGVLDRNIPQALSTLAAAWENKDGAPHQINSSPPANGHCKQESLFLSCSQNLHP